MKIAGWFGVILGILMFAQWGFFLATGQVPELRTAPLQIAFHLAAEGLTAIGLLVSGIALLKGKSWGVTIYLLSIGMMIYSAIVSPGYFAQQSQWGLVAMFGVLLAVALLSIASLVRDRRAYDEINGARKGTSSS
jgi:hypothetical protein